MAERGAPEAAGRLIWAAPQLSTRDVAALARWFEDALGFETVFLAGEPVHYGQVRRDAVRFNLRHTDHPPVDPALAQREELLAAYVAVEDIDALHAALAARGAAPPIVGGVDQPRYFIVATPDGELLAFAEG